MLQLAEWASVPTDWGTDRGPPKHDSDEVMFTRALTHRGGGCGGNSHTGVKGDGSYTVLTGRF